MDAVLSGECLRAMAAGEDAGCCDSTPRDILLDVLTGRSRMDSDCLGLFSGVAVSLKRWRTAERAASDVQANMGGIQLILVKTSSWMNKSGR